VLPRAWDTASAALTACAGALGDTREVRQIAAASGLAFRFSCDDECSLGSPHAYPFGEVLPACAARLGYRVEWVASTEPAGSWLHRDAQHRARALVAHGRPTLIWGVQAPEFGIALGLEGACLAVEGILGRGTVEEAGAGEVPIVFVLHLVERAPLPPEEATRAALQAALELGRGPTPTLSGFHVGLAALGAIARALEDGRVDPAGLAYAAQRLAESRAAGAEFLAEAAPEARTPYKRAAGMAAELARLLPFPPPPGAMLTTVERDQALELIVEQAKGEAEALDAIATRLSR
jgi:hypothetical protein